MLSLMIKKILKKSSLIVSLHKRYYDWRSCRRHMAASRRLQYAGPMVLKTIESVFREIKVSYFATFGTLLGFVRDNGFILHDVDIDIGILPGSDDHVLVLRKLLDAGFVFKRAFEVGGKIVEIALSYKDVPVDFFFYEFDGNRVWVDVFSTGGVYPNVNERMPVLSTTRGFYPPVSITYKKILGMTVPIIDNPEVVLELMYGKNWRTPISSCQETHKLSNRTSIDEQAYVIGKDIALGLCDL